LSDIGQKLIFLDQPQDALIFLERALEVLRRVLPENDPDIGGYEACFIAPNVSYGIMCFVSGGHMHGIAAILRELGRHHQALVLQEEAVNFYKRVLPHNDPRIGTVAQCSACHPDFAVFCNDVMLCFVTIRNDAMTGSAMHDLGRVYGALNRHTDALIVREKTLEFRRLYLPENHPHTGAMADKMNFNPSAVAFQDLS
jgi:hypothetical protein